MTRHRKVKRKSKGRTKSKSKTKSQTKKTLETTIGKFAALLSPQGIRLKPPYLFGGWNAPTKHDPEQTVLLSATELTIIKKNNCPKRIPLPRILLKEAKKLLQGDRKLTNLQKKFFETTLPYPQHGTYNYGTL